MDHYIDMRLLPDPEFAEPHLMAALFSKLHRALVARAGGQIGISFPGVKADPPWLGEVLRLHGTRSALEGFSVDDWLTGMRDHVQRSDLRAVPATATFRVVSRVQAKSNPERLRRRQMRRHGIDAQEALVRVPGQAVERLYLPFLQLRSQSTGESFRLFIRHGLVVQMPSKGSFGAYGLSTSATIPWF